MARGPSVLLLDDGELDDIQSLLEEVGVPYARVRGGAIVDGTPPLLDLLISTPRRIEAVRRVGIMVQPFIPGSAAKLLDLLAVPASDRQFAHAGDANALKAGATLPEPQGVFPRYVEKEGAGG